MDTPSWMIIAGLIVVIVVCSGFYADAQKQRTRRRRNEAARDKKSRPSWPPYHSQTPRLVPETLSIPDRRIEIGEVIHQQSPANESRINFADSLLERAASSEPSGLKPGNESRINFADSLLERAASSELSGLKPGIDISDQQIPQDIRCQVCHQDIIQGHWIMECTGCTYCVHAGCWQEEPNKPTQPCVRCHGSGTKKQF